MLFGTRRTPVESVRFKKKEKNFVFAKIKCFLRIVFLYTKSTVKVFFSHRIIYSTKLSTVYYFSPPQNEIFSLTKLSETAYFFFYQIVFHMWKYEQILWIYSFRQCIVLSIKSLQLNCSDPPKINTILFCIFPGLVSEQKSEMQKTRKSNAKR